jgi:alpha-beta hydrolase superfamily lysophospholipase
MLEDTGKAGVTNARLLSRSMYILVLMNHSGFITVFMYVLLGWFQAIGAPKDSSAFSVTEVRASLKSLSVDSCDSIYGPVKAYIDYYSLDFVNAAHCAGTFKSDSFVVAAHVFMPHDANATVFMIHGYYDHIGIMRNAIEVCLKKGCCVAALDLPGHGLSSGERSAIDDFAQYAHALNTFMRICSPHAPEPYILVGHSIGGAVVLEYMWTANDSRIKKLILLAPGLRSAYHGLSQFGHAVWRPFSATAPRWFRNASHDVEFLTWYRKEPLQYNRFPLRWASAFYSWQDRLSSYDTLSVALTVLQGTEDDVVDWKRNMKLIKTKAPHAKIIPIVGARHHLLNESNPWKQETLIELEKELSVGRMRAQEAAHTDVYK